jgi:cytoskeletal protein CcmA (bactofilin family)
MFEQKPKNIDGPGTIVGANVKLSGILKDVNDITVHGQIEGEIISDKKIIIEQTSQVKGPIKGKYVTIAGKVNGEIIASEKLEILESGEVKGGISTNDLIIKSGAVFNGKSTMKQSENPATNNLEAKKNIHPSKENKSKDSNKNIEL